MAGSRDQFFACFDGVSSPSELVARLRVWASGEPCPVDFRMQERRKMWSVDKTRGPMYFLGLQICKRMGEIGFPSRVHCCYRSGADQDAAFARGASRARAGQSPHQFLEAVDIVHEARAWDVPPAYWAALASVVRNVAADYGVELSGGFVWGWDLAHVELADWRRMRAFVEHRRPSEAELYVRFRDVLPSVQIEPPAALDAGQIEALRAGLKAIR